MGNIRLHFSHFRLSNLSPLKNGDIAVVIYFLKSVYGFRLKFLVLGCHDNTDK